jgi:hypothetical protein
MTKMLPKGIFTNPSKVGVWEKESSDPEKFSCYKALLPSPIFPPEPVAISHNRNPNDLPNAGRSVSTPGIVVARWAEVPSQLHCPNILVAKEREEVAPGHKPGQEQHKQGAQRKQVSGRTNNLSAIQLQSQKSIPPRHDPHRQLPARKSKR